MGSPAQPTRIDEGPAGAVPGPKETAGTSAGMGRAQNSSSEGLWERGRPRTPRPGGIRRELNRQAERERSHCGMAAASREDGGGAGAPQDRLGSELRFHREPLPEPGGSGLALGPCGQTERPDPTRDSPEQGAGGREKRDLPVHPVLAYNTHGVLIAIRQENSLRGQIWTLRLERLGGLPGSSDVWCRGGLLGSPDALSVGPWRPVGDPEPVPLLIEEALELSAAEQTVTSHDKWRHHLFTKAEILGLLLEAEGPPRYPFFSTARGAFLLSSLAFQRLVELAETRLGLPTQWLSREVSLVERACQRKGGYSQREAEKVLPTIWVGNRGEETVTRRHLERHSAEPVRTSPRPSWLDVNGPDEGKEVLEGLRLSVLLIRAQRASLLAQAQKEGQHSEATAGRQVAMQALQDGESEQELLADSLIAQNALYAEEA